MDIRDFQGLIVLKLYIPLLYITSWLCMFLGPTFFPVVYQKISIAILMYLNLKVIVISIAMVYILCQSLPLINRAKNYQQPNHYLNVTQFAQEINYAIIIPNYKEEIELISQTLRILASHKRAKYNYIIMLAMQAHEQGSQKKAQQLIQMFRNQFRVIDFTRHQIRAYEQKGKSSNVSWCAENIHKVFQKNMINPDSVMLTILDCDSWAPDLYFDVLQEKILSQFSQRHMRIYQPIQIYTRNNLEVPIITRILDVFTSYAHASNLWSFFGLTYSLSNYTVSYSLMRKIGFWDTCADAIGQDLHTCLKIYFKTKMQARGVPIYVPFNQVNISTGNGYCADVKARFWQSQRHGKGVADVAYTFKMFFTQPFRLKSIFVFWFVIQTFSLNALFPWLLISINYQSKLLYRFFKASPQLLSQDSVSFVVASISLFGTIAYLMYQVIKRRYNKYIYNRQNQSVFRVLQYSIGFVIVFFMITVPTFVLAAFKVLIGQQQYIVAQKKNTIKNVN